MTSTPTTSQTQGQPNGIPASGSRMGAGTGTFPKAGSGNSGVAPLRNDNARLLQVVLFWAGAILMPLGSRGWAAVVARSWFSSSARASCASVSMTSAHRSRNSATVPTSTLVTLR